MYKLKYMNSNSKGLLLKVMYSTNSSYIIYSWYHGTTVQLLSCVVVVVVVFAVFVVVTGFPSQP